MKILIFAPWIKSRGGAERVILRILQLFPQSKVITFYYDKSKTFEEFENYDIEEIGPKIGNPLLRGISLFLTLLFKKIKTDNYDIFLISTSGIAELAALRQKKNPVIFVHTPFRLVHNMYDYYKKSSILYSILLPIFARVYIVFEKRAYGKAEKIIVMSEEVKRRLIEYGLATEDKIVKISPLLTYKFQPSSKHKNYFLYLSRITPYKRQDLAIRAFLKSKAKDKYKLIIAGFVEDKEYFEKLQSLARGHKNIEILTNLSDKEVTNLYRNAYATLFLPINEDTGLVPLESFAFGKPVIAVNEGGPKEFVKNYENGFLVEANESDIASAIDRIINKKVYRKLTNNIIKNKGYAGDFDKEIKRVLSLSSNSNLF